MKKLIPAPVDGKNILTDWIEDMFDLGRSLCNIPETIVIGFVNDKPASCHKWGTNELLWFCGSEEGAKSVADRLGRLKMDERTVQRISVSGPSIHQYFYFLED